jgi:branched-chain amino acid transport system ATP-binding protein
MLELRGLSKAYGGLTVVADVAFDVPAGSVVGLIGPNGAGKTTCFNLIGGFVPADAGTVRFEGTEITGRRPDAVARLGLVRTFQQVSVFGQDTVLANVLQGAHLHDRTRLWGALWGTRQYRDRAGELAGRAMAVLERIGLADEAEVQAGALPYGKQKKLGMAVALAGAPRLLMLDEPVAGLNPTESAEIARLIGRLRADGLTILLVEHDMRTVMSLCDRIVVLSEGVKIAEGLPAEIRRDPEVIRVYLGSGLAARAVGR